MKFFFKNYWLQVIGVFVALFLGSRAAAMVLADIEGTGRISTVGNTSSGSSQPESSEVSEMVSEPVSEESSENPLDELFESTDWSDSLESSTTTGGSSSTNTYRPSTSTPLRGRR